MRGEQRGACRQRGSKSIEWRPRLAYVGAEDLDILIVEGCMHAPDKCTVLYSVRIRRERTVNLGFVLLGRVRLVCGRGEQAGSAGGASVEL